MKNLFSLLPANLEVEEFRDLLKNENIRIERIISRGHTSPKKGWYDQEEHEWVIVLQGSGSIVFEDGSKITLEKGDFLNIPSHKKHKVSWTDSNNLTVWLAIFYK